MLIFLKENGAVKKYKASIELIIAKPFFTVNFSLKKRIPATKESKIDPKKSAATATIILVFKIDKV